MSLANVSQSTFCGQPVIMLLDAVFSKMRIPQLGFLLNLLPFFHVSQERLDLTHAFGTLRLHGRIVG